jgi:hypothetical protein
MRHTFEIDAIYVNPVLPEDFDCTPHDERDEEMNWWWYKPYILIEELQQESWDEHYHRLKNVCDWDDEKIGTKEKWLKHLQEQKESWYKEYPLGFRYEVRILDGGAWDRSTWKGFFNNFDDALELAKNLYEGE